MNTQHDNTAGKGFRVKNPPQVDGHAASAIERNYRRELFQSDDDDTISSVSSPLSATGSNIGISPAGQESGLGPPDKSARPIKRGYAKTYWSREEKKQILHSFAYSRHEKWRGSMNQVFEKQLGKSDLPKDKLEASSTSNMVSLMSQIHRYLSEEEINHIKLEGKRVAEMDIEAGVEQQIDDLPEKQWTAEEKWVLTWSIEYAKCKFKKATERCTEWQRILRHHCPHKRHAPKSRLTTQKNNIERANLFSEEALKAMRDQIDDMITNNVCPIENPLQFPHIPPQSPPQQNSQTPRQLSPHQPSQPDLHSPVLQRHASPHPSQSPATAATPSSPEQNQVFLPDRVMDDSLPEESFFEPEPVNQEEEQMKDELMNTIELVRAMKMEDRPSLIKLVQNKKFKTLRHSVDKCLDDLFPGDMSITELNNISFGAALYIQRIHAPWYDESRKKSARKGKIVYPWKVKMQKKIDKLRAELSQMMTYEPVTKHLIRKVKRIKRKYGIKDNKDIPGRIAEHQAEIKALAAQIRNKERKENTKTINKKFGENPRKVYREIMKESIEVLKPPCEEQLENFWRPLYETPVQHKENEWINTIISENRERQEMAPFIIDLDHMKRKLKEFSNFKAPGIDKIPNFWLKQFNSLLPKYVSSFNNIKNGEEPTPDWLTTGQTKLLPKSQETERPNKYRPICCLSTTYKLLTGLISDAIYCHLGTGQLSGK